MINVNLVPRARFEPNRVDNLRDVQYSCGCAKLSGQVVTLCTRHTLEDFKATRARAKDPESRGAS